MVQASRAVLVAVAIGAVISIIPVSIAHSTVARASKKNPAVQREPMIHQMIVKLRNPKALELVAPLDAERVLALSIAGGVTMKSRRPMSGGASVLKLDAPLSLSQAKSVAERLTKDPSVEYASPDLPMHAYQTVPADNGYAVRMWDYYPPNQNLTANGKTVPAVGGANLPGAWNVSRGSPTVVVALIDSGIVSSHPELAGKWLQGYDFVSSDVGSAAAQPVPANFVANDNNGRDPDPEDPGDWVSTADTMNYPDLCGTMPYASFWHGTHMAGTIVGVWNNGVGGNPPPGSTTAGIAPDTRILPLRALGKCGGLTSDVIDAIRFAVGIPVQGAGGGLVVNGTPAQIINLSLGGQGGSCSQAYQAAVTDVTAAGALVVAAAGNDGLGSVSQPANCNDVLAVTAHTINGDNADYSNYGAAVAISSPGGGDPSAIPSPIVSTDNGFYTWSSGLYGATDQQSSGSPPNQALSGPAIVGFTGTSSATAHVSAIAALLKSVLPTATPARIRDLITSTARPHPNGGFCQQAKVTGGSDVCGAGLIDASAAMSAAVPAPPSGGSGGGGGALSSAQLLVFGLFGLLASLRRRG